MNLALKVSMASVLHLCLQGHDIIGFIEVLEEMRIWTGAGEKVTANGRSSKSYVKLMSSRFTSCLFSSTCLLGLLTEIFYLKSFWPSHAKTKWVLEPPVICSPFIEGWTQGRLWHPWTQGANTELLLRSANVTSNTCLNVPKERLAMKHAKNVKDPKLHRSLFPSVWMFIQSYPAFQWRVQRIEVGQVVRVWMSRYPASAKTKKLPRVASERCLPTYWCLTYGVSTSTKKVLGSM